MKKNIRLIVAVMVVAVILTSILTTTFPKAEEIEPPVDEGVVEGEGTESEVPEEVPVPDEIPEVPEANEAIEKLNAVLAWLEEQIPLISSITAALIGAVLAIVNKIKLHTVSAFFTKEKEKTAALTSALDKQSVETLRAELIPIIRTALTEEIEKLEITDAVYADMKAENKLILAALSSLIRGATNAWAQSPAAVAELTKTADDVAVHNLSLQVVALEKLLYAKYGADAKELIEKARAGEV